MQSSRVIALPGTATKNALMLPANMTRGQFVDLFELLGAVDSASQWWWGDAINAAETAHGEMYTEAMARSGKPYETLRQYARISRAYQTGERSPLSWSHHLVAADLPEPDALNALRIAEERKLSVSALRALVREIKNPQPLPPPAPSGSEPQHFPEDEEEPLYVDDIEPEGETQHPPAIERRGIGLRKANEAIAALREIPVNDALRSEALDHVARWIAANR